jgi:hypothetical protein
MAKIAMKWLGNGFYLGVPARDLSAQEVERFGRDFLLALGLYKEINPPKPKRAKEPKLEPEQANEIEEEQL